MRISDHFFNVFTHAYTTEQEPATAPVPVLNQAPEIRPPLDAKGTEYRCSAIDGFTENTDALQARGGCAPRNRRHGATAFRVIDLRVAPE